MWLILNNRAMEIVEYNTTYHPNGVWELWVIRPTGKSICILKGNEAEVKIYIAMFDAAVKGGHRFIEMKEIS